MRLGINKSKDIEIKGSGKHKVIIPLYVPFLDGYYKEAYDIFIICLNSLKKTSITDLNITIVSNCCCDEVNSKLFDLYNKKEINELIITNNNIGKINSILIPLRCSEEEFITIVDADVLFLNGWELNVFKIFKEFPKTGVVSPVPVFRKHNDFTHNIWFDFLLSKRLSFTKVKNPEAMTRFANSIGWPWLDKKYKDVMLTLQSRSGTKAMVGCSHFVATYRNEVFRNLPKYNSKFQLGGDSEKEYLDKVVIKSDFYRLSTEDNYAFHMGNNLESWHIEEYNKIKRENKSISFPYSKFKGNSYGYILKSKLFKWFISKRITLELFYKIKGLNKNQINNFIEN